MAKLTTEEFIAAIKELTVLELNELVKACEEEFDVSPRNFYIFIVQGVPTCVILRSSQKKVQ